MRYKGNHCRVFVSAALALLALPAFALTQIEIQKLIASDGAQDEQFGVDIAIDGDTAVIGGRGYAQSDTDGGSAYIFTQDATGVWTQQGKLTASDGVVGDEFGRSVYIDGDTAIIGAYADDDNGDASGSAYVFTRDATGVWTQQAKLTASDGAIADEFGWSVAISGDTAIIGSFPRDHSASAYVFTRDGSGAWTEQVKLTPNDGAFGDQFGYSVDIEGNTALIGASRDWNDSQPINGLAYIFNRDSTGTWTQEAVLTASDGVGGDLFGHSVDIEGGTALIGAPRDHDDSRRFPGSAYVFTRDGSGVWTEQAKLTLNDGMPGNMFGARVGISGVKAVIGARYDDDVGLFSGAAYVFSRDATGVWTQQAKLTASDLEARDTFGFGAAIEGNTALIGANNDDDNGNSSGSVYVFDVTPPINVAIDIKPGTETNSVNPKSKGKIPVAILTTDTFIATQVDWDTVSFGPDGARKFHAMEHVKDVDEDGDLDLLLHFNTPETGIVCGDTEATLTGELFSGEPITGTDTINTVPCR